MQLWLVLLSVLTLSLTLTDGQNTSCGNDFKTLEKALLLTGNNKVELLRAFYPPRQPPATFVTVHYIFLDLDGSITCQKTWLWSSVDFYLIQPPSIFQFMSLLFTIPLDRSITTANITFPGDCQNLVTNENKSCTCISNGLLDILTQRVSIKCTSQQHHRALHMQHKTRKWIHACTVNSGTVKGHDLSKMAWSNGNQYSQVSL